MIEFARFGNEENQLPVEADRYRLVVSPVCPWCRRVAIARRLLGLEDVLPISEATGRSDDGFVFSSDICDFDPVLRVRTTRELYRRQSDWNIGDPTSVPVMVDTTGRIVAGESSHLLHDCITLWYEKYGKGDDLYPHARRDELSQRAQEIESKIVTPISTYVHARGEEKIASLENISRGLNWAEDLLENQPYFSGENYMMPDIPAFSALTTFLAERSGVSANCSFESKADDESSPRDDRDIHSTDTALDMTSLGFVEPISMWPSVARWWVDLALTPGWVSDSEQDALNIPSPDILRTYMKAIAQWL